MHLFARPCKSRRQFWRSVGRRGFDGSPIAVEARPRDRFHSPLLRASKFQAQQCEVMKLEGAVIAVTGGASGLGESTVELCVSKGAKVAVTRHL